MTVSQLEKIAISCLEKSYQVHQKLGSEGEELIAKNQYGETALKIDIEAEKTVINTLKQAKVPIRIISEEHGTTNISDNPKYLGVLDGLDGTEEYKKNRGRGRYGTMFGIFSNLDPKYQDYIFGGIMEHSTKRLFFVSKNKGSFIKSDKKTEQIHCSDCTTLDKKTRIYIDQTFDEKRNVTFIYDTFISKLKEYKFNFLLSTATHYADLVKGEVDLVLECTRKGNLELAVAYGLVTEAGGFITALDGKDLGQKKYLEFGQDQYTPVIAASTKELAKNLIKRLN